MSLFRLLPVALLISLLGCGSAKPDADIGEIGNNATTPHGLPVPANWIGYQAGAKAPTFQTTGKMTRSTVQALAARTPGPAPDPVIQPSTGSFKPSRGTGLTGPDGTIYQLNASAADIGKVASAMRQRYVNGSVPSAPLPGKPPAKTAAAAASGNSLVASEGLPYGIDDRTMWPYTTFEHSSRDFIGRVTDNVTWCSSSIIWQNLVLTAMHCFFDRYGNWLDLSFEADADSTAAPYGEVHHTWKFWDTAYVDNHCDTNFTADCQPYDWVVMVLESRPISAWDGVPIAWMEVWAAANSSLKYNYHLYTFGYPQCGLSYSPRNCEPETMWGDDGFAIGQFTNYQNNNSRDMYMAASVGPGQSGSPVFTYDLYGGWPTVVGILTNQNCGGSDCTNVKFTATARQIDPDLSNAISYYKSLFPL